MIQLKKIFYYRKTQINSDIKIADFGLSAQLINQHKKLFQKCGSPGYIAPEIIYGRCYDQKVDIYSVGVVLYIL